MTAILHVGKNGAVHHDARIRRAVRWATAFRGSCSCTSSTYRRWPGSCTSPHEVTVHAVVLDHDTIAAQWCTASMCHLTRISFGGAEPDSEHSYIEVFDDVPLPTCSG